MEYSLIFILGYIIGMIVSAIVILFFQGANSYKKGK